MENAEVPLMLIDRHSRRHSRRMVLQCAAALALVAAFGLPANAQEAAAPTDGGSQREVVEMSMGDPDAPVTVVEYASLTCPHCATFHAEGFPELKANYIDEGLVHFTLRDVYFDRPGLWGAMLARCSGPDRYFGVVDLLFENQATWSRQPDAPSIVEELYAIGRQAGMTSEAMDACLRDQAFAQALVAEYQANVQEDGVDSTPTFFINGEKTSNMPWPELEERIKAELPS
jgi:protein-disulfide isomerase